MNKKDKIILAVAFVLVLTLPSLGIYFWNNQPTPVYPRTAAITIENGNFTAIYPVNSTTWYSYPNGTSGFYYGGPRFSSSNFTEVFEWASNQTK
jgi:hypothetical protein